MTIDPDSVRCLACRAVYAKPAAGVAPGAGPCCPRCECVAWIAVPVLRRAA
jgi:hypothetical protein